MEFSLFLISYRYNQSHFLKLKSSTIKIEAKVFYDNECSLNDNINQVTRQNREKVQNRKWATVIINNHFHNCIIQVSNSGDRSDGGETTRQHPQLFPIRSHPRLFPLQHVRPREIARCHLLVVVRCDGRTWLHVTWRFVGGGDGKGDARAGSDATRRKHQIHRFVRSFVCFSFKFQIAFNGIYSFTAFWRWPLNKNSLTHS